jgi:hypothetical protein
MQGVTKNSKVQLFLATQPATTNLKKKGFLLCEEAFLSLLILDLLVS